MSSAFRRTLPARPDLEQQRKLAKELLAGFRASDPESQARVRAALPDKSEIALADAQFVLSREYGFTNWSELVAAIESRREDARPPLELFKAAVQNRDAKAARNLLNRHQTVRAAINDTIFAFGGTALLASNDSVAMIDVLLEFGADPNKRSDWWAGPFHVLHGARGAAAKRLMTGGAVPDACGAANLDDVALLERMLAENPDRVNERGGDGKTPLHFARSRAAIDLLLGAGANLDARDVDHRSTAAEWMIGDEPGGSRVELARYLVDRGAGTDIFLAAALGLGERARSMLSENPKLLALRTSQGEYAEQPPSSYHVYQWTIGPNMSPLQVAAKFRQRETVEVMRGFASPQELLLLACHEADSAQAHDIVARNPGIVDRLGPAERRALTDEAWAPNPPAVALMMELGFDPSEPSVSGPTGGNALHCAAWEGSVGAVKAILDYPRGRALLESRDPSYNGTPLSWCCHGSTNCGNPTADHAEVARVLIAAGATVDPDMQGCSSPMQAVLAAASRRG